ncbi:DMT family transporter [Xanthobacter dioxanivorans]|uniref:DMT family transporter n=1 Tax=Xanthobacter dioxanivorans TaxID=2528964 RepID=A0A974SI69_9HYPH|nr:DMT family transporter [Xanthobacter dioxanivorans]QRG05078.1 DMT family transporter [Xanthobacter dioxanivorans]
MNAPAGIGLQICATFFFAVMSALVRLVAQDVPSGEIVFARSFFGLVPVIAWLVASGRMWPALATRAPAGHVVRGLVGVSSMWMSFGALAFIPLAEAIAFSYATPLVTVVLAAVLLGERVPLFRWVVLAVGLAGIMLMLWPSFSHAAVGTGRAPLIGSALALTGALGAAFAVTQVRHLTRTETSEAIVFYFSLVAACAGLATAPFGWVLPDASTAFVLVAMGLAGGVGQICMTAANRYAPASVVAPLNYATLIWATGLGILMFGEWPPALVAAGASVVVVSGLLLVWRERPARRRRRAKGAGGPRPREKAAADPPGGRRRRIPPAQIRGTALPTGDAGAMRRCNRRASRMHPGAGR